MSIAKVSLIPGLENACDLAVRFVVCFFIALVLAASPRAEEVCDRSAIADLDIRIPTRSLDELIDGLKSFAAQHRFDARISYGASSNDVVTVILRDDLMGMATTEDIAGEPTHLTFDFSFYTSCDRRPISAEVLQTLIGGLRGNLGNIAGLSIVERPVPKR